MSTKKKVGISDLLRDEVQKETEVPVRNESTEQTIEVKAETIADTTSKVASRPEISAVEKSPSVSDRSVSDRNAKISELERSLAQSRQRETELSQTVADLQKDLQFSHTNIELLQKSLAAIESLKNELDQQLVAVKRDNLRLAEANIQLSEQGKLAQPPVVEAASASQLVPQNPQNNRATPRKQPVEQPYPQRDRNPYARPTGSNEQLQRINNKNIGWMD
jgi:predicted RNase H-like nuclease (RuvC/YqgF family)